MRSTLFTEIAALACSILLLSLRASAQKISAGVVAGGSLTDAYRDVTIFQFRPSPEPGAPPRLEGARYWSPSKDYVIGGMLEVRFNPHWSLEVNGCSGNCTAVGRASRYPISRSVTHPPARP